VTVDEVARLLYRLPPGEFTSARNARAKEAAALGDRELAAAVRALPKPTAAAWLANTVVGRAAPAVDDLVALGPEFRHAQDKGLRADMRRLVDRRRTLIGDLVAVAADAADDAGQPFGTQVQRQLEETLEAAVADETLATVLRSGLMSGPLRFVGFGGPPDAPRSAGTARLSVAAVRAEKTRRARERSEAAREAARRAWQSAEEKVRTASRHRDEADERHRSAVKEERAAERQRRAATVALERAQQQLVEARRKLDAVQSAHEQPASDADDEGGRR
jgi:hypothetical protein